MKNTFIFLIIFSFCLASIGQQQNAKPCAVNPVYRQFDFWIGQWDVFGKNGQKAGDSKITLILDSCIILEEWTSASAVQGLIYAGKSFNTYNARTNNGSKPGLTM